MKQRLFLFFSFSLGIFLFLAILAVSFLQTKWAQNLILGQLAQTAQEHGIGLYIEKAKVSSPFHWSIEKGCLSFETGEKIEIEDLSFKLAPLSLLEKRITLRSFSAKKINASFFLSESSWNETYEDVLALSKQVVLGIYLKNLSIETLVLEDLASGHALEMSLAGRIKLQKLCKEIEINLFCKEARSLSQLEVTAISSQKTQEAQGVLDFQLKDSQNLSLFLGLPSFPDMKGTLTLQRNSPFSSFSLYTEISSFPQEKISCLQDLSIEVEGEIFEEEGSPVLLSCHTFHVHNKDFDVSGPWTLSKNYLPLSFDIRATLNETSKLGCLLPFQGSAKLEAHLASDDLSLSCSSPSLNIGHQTYAPAAFRLNALKNAGSWKGDCELFLSDPLLPWKESLHFSLEEQKLELSDFTLCIGEAKIGGVLSCSLEDFSYEGSFFVMAEELRPFRQIFPSSELDGKLGGSFSLEGNPQDFSLDLALLFRNVRYQNSLVDTVRLEADLHQLLTSPFGTLSCDAKDLFFNDMVLSQLLLTSEPAPQGKQTFSFELLGDWKKPVKIETAGSWAGGKEGWSLTMDSCQGSFLSESFSLQAPFSIEQTKDLFFLEKNQWKIGEGSFSAEATWSPDLLKIEGEGAHLPLGILGVLYPQIDFEGAASFQTSLSGAKNETKGHFFGTIEKAEFSQNKAKGSLQVHFSPLGMQIYSHLYATKNQFLDLTATLPLDDHLAPFAWSFDKTRSVTGELTMQGSVEDIFDFMNTASHLASGWITAHLFLSHTLEQPSLLGSLKCEQGEYKNYFTGTHLKKIEADLSAESGKILLSSLTADDENEGTLSISGSLELSPQKNFPFEVTADLNNVYLVHSDLIEASLSGSLHFQGSTASTHAYGSLSVDRAVFKIFDDLPAEIPSIPVTYINKPIYLQTTNLDPSPPYPVSIDIEMKADDSVFVEGRGLESQWNGTARIIGTLSEPVAQGSLHLSKGKFVFSGKTFTLMQGEIAFFDKPSPGAYLKINGELSLPSAIVLAQMQGPLTAPQLTFQSIPSLPTSSILSLVLFDKDISEISTLQTLQLAQTIVSLSGNGGPGVLESIRKKIGVDKLNIVGKDGTDEISVQIGWYLNHGITLSLSQSATSSDVTVEVDLKNGFIFQAETQNQEEGKFSLKWNNNY